MCDPVALDYLEVVNHDSFAAIFEHEEALLEVSNSSAPTRHLVSEFGDVEVVDRKIDGIGA